MSSPKQKLFDYVIGNPPYSEDFANSGYNGNFAKPVYPDFMDAAYEVANKSLLIHPARFLFNAGATPKPWNKKMLNDPHFKVLEYEADSSKVFPNTDIKGGVAVSYRDADSDFDAIGTFTSFPELNGILHKSKPKDETESLASIVFNQVRYNLETLYSDYPDLKNVIGSNGRDRRLRNNAFYKINVFTTNPVQKDDIKIIGIQKNKRTWRYIPCKYVSLEHQNLQQWKVLVPRANGSGALGEVLSTPLIGEPLIGHTQTFISIGSFEKLSEAEACMKYVKTKFARVLLGIKKVTQDNPRDTWEYVPLQDFTEESDIDWTQTVEETDRQLYAKYGLDEEEIRFIETRVKEMK